MASNNISNRILIVDWDIHHGNGIQRMFEEDPRVLYVSLHRGDFFPLKIEESDCNVVGKGVGTGYSVNIAWPHVIIDLINFYGNKANNILNFLG